MELKYFKPQQEGFVTYDADFLTLLAGVPLVCLLVGWGISVFVRGYVVDFQSVNTTVRTLAPLWMLLSLHWLSTATVRIRIIPARHAMIREYLFGIYRKEYMLAAPLEVTVSTHYHSGRRVDSDVYVKTRQGFVTVRRFPQSKQVEPFIEELKSLFD